MTSVPSVDIEIRTPSMNEHLIISDNLTRIRKLEDEEKLPVLIVESVEECLSICCTMSF